ncbi:MAG TPA: ATP-binding protein [Patescibacteria group bacterium]|nr:ATP-binding protein [Patescibacteria group bacterium]
MEFLRKQQIEIVIAPRRALVIYGPRRIGKTTLLKSYLFAQKDKKILYVVGDDFRVRELFTKEIRDELLDFARPYDIVAIDEAQQVPSIGLGAKMIVDAFPEKQLILTGSSSFDLSSKIGEPLTGRHFTLTLLPIAQSEISGSRFEIKNNLNNFLIYGAYPEVLSAGTKDEKTRILNELVSSYLYKDILALDKIKSPDLLRDITRCLAFQVGNEVSLNEIANTVKSDVKTVGRYIDVLEKMFVIKKIRGFSRNLRNEISKKAKYYFLDNGTRNAVIGQFGEIEERNDIGALWENFVFMELYKKSVIGESQDQYYFWRTHTGKEIDIIQERAGNLTAIECKWSSVAKEPSLWREVYPESAFLAINRENYLDELLSR